MFMQLIVSELNEHRKVQYKRASVSRLVAEGTLN